MYAIRSYYGLMPAYGYPIPPADRWAIVAHVRRLQQERLAREVASACETAALLSSLAQSRAMTCAILVCMRP